MRLHDHARPGAGLIVLVASLFGAISFFAWGLATPPLDEVWRIQLELELGESGPLSAREFGLLQDTLRRYPALADNMVEDGVAGPVSANRDSVFDLGYAYLVRKRSEAPGKLQVTAIDDDPVEVEVRTLTASASGETRRDATYTWQVPNDGPFPQLVEVRLAGEHKSGFKPPKKGPRWRSGVGSPPVVVALTP